MKKVAIIMGSDSDLPVCRTVADKLAELGVPFTARVLSAHRTPDEVREFAVSARENGYGVFIAMAGMSAALPGSIAAATTLPVVGIPVKSSFEGLDALLAVAQMPPGVPVAAVAVNGAVNAAILAAQILAVEDAELSAKLARAKEDMRKKVLEKDAAVQNEFAGR